MLPMPRLVTRVVEEMSSSAPHPLGRVGARRRSCRSATSRSGPVGCVSSSAREVGTHERGAAETLMRGEVLSPKARWVAVRISEIFPPLSPLLRARCPHRRMDRIRSFGSTLTVVARDGDDDTVSRIAALSTFSTDVCGGVCPTVPHPLGRVLV